MEPSIAEREGAVYYDMDSLPLEIQSEEMRRQYQKAEKLLDGAIQKFAERQECRNLVPRIQQVGEDAGKELVWRMEKNLQNLNLPQADMEILRRQMEDTAAKVVDKLLFELRNEADQETLQKTVEIFEQVFAR